VYLSTVNMNSFLDEIPGQIRVKNTLNNFIKSKNIPHALLFSGIDGLGKDNAAIKFAQAVVEAENSKEFSRSSRFIQTLSEPEIKFIFPLPRGKNETDNSSPTEKLTNDDLELLKEQIKLKIENPFHKINIPKANTIKINSIRDIKKFLTLNYNEICYRFVLISDAHLMNDEAQNALLKSLEEPPERVIFILTTSVISKLKSTIISRCWRINFDPLSEDEIVTVLKNYFKISDKIAREVAPFAMGSIQSAVNLAGADFHDLKEKVISILRFSFGRKYYSAFNELNSILSDQRNVDLKMIISLIIAWLNDIQKQRLYFSKFYFKDHLDTLEKFNKRFPDIELSDITSRLDKLSTLPAMNINPSLLSSALIFELSSVVLPN
jgi:DNA polymerase-3 subunit delta'